MSTLINLLVVSLLHVPSLSDKTGGFLFSLRYSYDLYCNGTGHRYALGTRRIYQSVCLSLLHMHIQTASRISSTVPLVLSMVVPIE